LEGQLSNLKKEYARMIVQAYKNRSAYDKMMYVFASEDFNQAYKRFKMTQHYADIRKQQVAQIEKTQSNINTNISLLQQDKQLKESLATTKEKEKNQIAENKVEQQSKLSALRKEEQKLRDQQRKQESDRKKLTAKIQEEIEKEMEAERRRAEAAAKAKAASSTTASSSSTASSTTTAKTDNTAKATAPKSIELAPETKLANADFEKNKGGLPWPVSSGVITSHFGVRNHESLAGIVTNNNGLDFTTEREAAALAVFGGTVTSVFNIPGAGQNVIITHGTYKTVYAGLSSLNVKVGDRVSPKDKIGTVMSDGEDYTLHFEVWKVSGDTRAAQNPEVWIKKR
jgi:murein hydrolase activator